MCFSSATNAGLEETGENEYWDNTNKGILLPASISGAESWYPADGYREYDGTLYVGDAFGCYWSSTFSDSDYAYLMSFFSDEIYPENYVDKYFGHSLRAVRE